MKNIKLQTVYIPVKTEDELPNKETFYFTIQKVIVTDPIQERLSTDSFKNNKWDIEDNTNDLMQTKVFETSHWLKEQQLIIFTQEQYNEHIKSVIENTLKVAAENAKICKDLGENQIGIPQFDVTECYYDEEGYPIYVEEESITNLLPQLIKQYEL